MAPSAGDQFARDPVTEVALTSGITPHGTLRGGGSQGLVVTAAYKNGVHSRGLLLVSPGLISFSPFDPADGAEEATRAVSSVTMVRGGRAPWSSSHFQLDGPVPVRIVVPRRSQRRVRELLSAADIHCEQT
jgi:hypothetical protein